MSICTRRATRPQLHGRKTGQGGHIQGCLHPGKLGVCFPALVSSWSISPTTELGLHPAPCPQAEGGWEAEGGVYCSPELGVVSCPGRRQRRGWDFSLGREVMEGLPVSPLGSGHSRV